MLDCACKGSYRVAPYRFYTTTLKFDEVEAFEEDSVDSPVDPCRPRLHSEDHSCRPFTDGYIL